MFAVLTPFVLSWLTANTLGWWLPARIGLAALVATIAREVQEKGPEALKELQQRAAMLQEMGNA